MKPLRSYLVLVFTILFSLPLFASDIDPREIKIESIDFTDNALEALHQANITTLGQLAQFTVLQARMKVARDRVKIQRELHFALHSRGLRFIDEANDFLETLNISHISRLVLRNAGKTTRESLVVMSRDEILRVPNASRRTVNELTQALREPSALEASIASPTSDIQEWLRATLAQTSKEDVRSACEILLREL